ncbi:GNAT family N-acetyltransferase [Paenibacillus thailandensis]|uniref:GNAT family N-acetyltransferase n=1 Tax=Paenibacillus thailandensis TaxID=393250 RepID=A0ABW5QYI7_9BACL
MITYRFLNELPIGEVSGLWNAAFEGYFVDASMPLDRFIARVAAEGLSLERSLACYVDGERAGIVMNAFREVDGKMQARNAGTAIVPKFRRSGIGKAMMERNEELYKEYGAKRAVLEAISRNEPAIRLYERQGYRIADRLKLLSGERFAAISPEAGAGGSSYTVSRGPAAEAAALSWYRQGEIWQAGLPSLKDGECILVRDGEEAVGFGLIRRRYDDNGRLAGIVLFRCEAAPGRTDREAVLLAALREIWQPELDCSRSAFNISSSEDALLGVLERMGFAETMEQVLMVKELA